MKKVDERDAAANTKKETKEQKYKLFTVKVLARFIQSQNII